MQILPCLLGLFSLINGLFLECTGFVLPSAMFIPSNLHLSWNFFLFFIFIVARWCFSSSKTILKYIRSWSDVRPYIITSSTMMFDGTFSAYAHYLMLPNFVVALSWFPQILELSLMPQYESPSIVAFRLGWKIHSFVCLFFCRHLPIITVHINHNELFILFFNVLRRIITMGYKEVKLASGLFQLYIWHTQPPLVLVSWHIFLVWFFSYNH